MNSRPHLLPEMLRTRQWLLADGATGTNFFTMGLQAGDAPEQWNVDQPQRVADHYQRFIDAGSDIILTNSFGGTHYRLQLHNLQHRVQELNIAAAAIARQRTDVAGRDIVVAGSIGPSGEILEPTGNLTVDEARIAFSEQACALRDGGADALWIETMSSMQEVEAAVLGCTETGLPVVFTLSIDTNGRTMMGVSANDIIHFERGLRSRPLAFGANCGVGPAEVVAAVVNLVNAVPAETGMPYLVAKANCGIPRYVDGEIVYNGTPDLMADYACLALDAGARIIGGCCGATPAHIAAMHRALSMHQSGARPDMETIVGRLGEISTGSQAQLRGELSVAAGAVSGGAGRGNRRRRH